jgi:hypothetical protein
VTGRAKDVLGGSWSAAAALAMDHYLFLC